MEKRKVTSEGYFRLLLILFAAMLFSQFTLVGTMIFLQQMGEIHLDEAGLSSTMMYVLIAAATVGLLASNVVGNMLIVKARSKPILSEKLRGYQTASILRYALLELPTVVGIYGFLSTGQYWFFTFSAVAVALFLMIIPRKEKVCEVLQLNHDEIALLNDPKAVIMEYETSAD
ncbi:MAG: hypothetical protein RLZZ519_439 [Bacteroidota bacterium]|jgi:hypothetical protein